MGKSMELLKDICGQFGVELNDEQISQFNTYYEMLIEWNKVMNLTSITEKKDVMYKHFADSLLIAKFKDMKEPLKVIDVGTGAGFPGIPLKIAFPELKMTLMDSLQKRLTFLDEVIKTLGITDIETVHMRAEDGGKNMKYREQYDLVVSRAVSALAALSELCLPFAKVGGYFIPYKSVALNENDKEEMQSGKKAIRILGGQVENIFTTNIPEIDAERKFVFVKKIQSTDMKYPRKAGTVTKKPLA